MRHRSPTARPCTAQDIFAVTGGLQCGNCGAHSVPALVTCTANITDDVPCPLPPIEGSDRCSFHPHNRGSV